MTRLGPSSWAPKSFCLFFFSVLLANGLAVSSQTTENVDSDYSTISYDSKPSRIGVILPVIITVLLLATAITFFVYDHYKSKPPQVETQEEFICILCTEDDAAFEYKMVFRVGCPTANFDMQNGYIDIEVLGPEDQVQGNPIRFDCSLLPDRICSELHVFIGSLHELKEITGIQVNHGDKHGSIFLFEYVLQDLSDESILEVCRFNTFITNRKAIYRGKKWSEDDEDQGEDDCYPELPVLEWTTFELAIITVFLVIAIGAAVILFEYYNLYPGRSSREDGSLIRSLWDMLYVVPLGIVFLTAVAVPYKYHIKRNLLKTEYSFRRLNLDFWRTIVHIFNATLFLLSSGLAGMTIYYGTRVSFIKSLYWYSSTLVVSVFVISAWNTANKSNWLRAQLGEGNIVCHATKFASRKGPKEGDTKPVLPNDSSKRPSTNAPKDQYAHFSDANSVAANKTLFFSRQQSSKSKRGKLNPAGDGANEDNISLFGPTLLNPKKMKQRKKAKKGGGKLAARKKRNVVALKALNKSKKTTTKSGKKTTSKKSSKKSSKKRCSPSSKKKSTSTKKQAISTKSRSKRTGKSGGFSRKNCTKTIKTRSSRSRKSPCLSTLKKSRKSMPKSRSKKNK